MKLGLGGLASALWGVVGLGRELELCQTFPEAARVSVGRCPTLQDEEVGPQQTQLRSEPRGS